MSKAAVVLLMLSLASCGRQSSAAQQLGYIAPVCEQSAVLSGEGEKLNVSGYLYEKSAQEYMCVHAERKVVLNAPLRIVPYQDGSVDVDFVCDGFDAEDFFKKNAGKDVAFVSANKVMAKAHIPQEPMGGRCALLHQQSLADSVALCEEFARALKNKKEQCISLCVDSGDEWACVAHK